MKKLILLLIIFSQYVYGSDCLSIQKQYLKELHALNRSAELIFAQILALQLGQQFSNNRNSLSNDLLISFAKFKQRLNNLSSYSLF